MSLDNLWRRGLRWPTLQRPTHVILALTVALAILLWTSGAAWSADLAISDTPRQREAARLAQTLWPTKTSASGDQALAEMLFGARMHHALARSRAAADDTTPYHDSLLRVAELKAYPWLTESLPSLRRSWPRGSKGVVFTLGRAQAIYAYTSILGIRKLGSRLPVAVMYGGDDDLPPRFQELFKSLDGVQLVDMSQRVSMHRAALKGWAWKPFAMLYAPFEQVILVDSDGLFFQKPDVLLEDPGYKQTGTLFFHDRTIPWSESGGNTTQWVAGLVPQLSDTARGMRTARGVGQQEQESAVVVINKAGDGLHALLVSCSLNAQPLRESVTYRNVYGDKETYWIAFEVLGLPYTFMPGYGSALGHVSGWWNKGQANKVPQRYLDFEYYRVDHTAEGVDWMYRKEEKMSFCLMQRDPQTGSAVPPRRLSAHDRATAQFLIRTQQQAMQDPRWLHLWRELGLY
ncbi:hypothetical protein RI367_002633 [Sorochytrium milnesiophthora]